MDTCSSQDAISVKLLAAAASDEVLFAAGTLGDGPALVELCERHSNTTFKIAYRITGNRDHAEAVAQNLRAKANIHSTTFRRQRELFDLPGKDCDQFCAYDFPQKTWAEEMP